MNNYAHSYRRYLCPRKNKVKMKRILFVNGSPNRAGHTAALARQLLAGKSYETLHLTDYKIYPLGQTFADDRFDEVLQRMSEADLLVMGSPVYWHSMSGQFRTLLDRIYAAPRRSELSGRELVFLFQGAGPSSAMLQAGDYTMRIFCRLFGLRYRGMVIGSREAEQLGKNL